MSKTLKNTSKELLIAQTRQLISKRARSLGFIDHPIGSRVKLLGENTFLLQTHISQEIDENTPLELIFFKSEELYSLYTALAPKNQNFYKQDLEKSFFTNILKKSLVLNDFHSLIST